MTRRVLTDPAAKRGRASRQKGHQFEREVAQRFREVTGLSSDDIKRGLGQARQKGDVPDVLAPLLWIECKRVKKGKLNLKAALAQAVGDEGRNRESRIPLVVGKEDEAPPVVSLYLEDFLPMYIAWWRGLTR